MADSSSTLEILVEVVHATEGAAKIRDVGKAGEDAAAGAKKSEGSYGKMAVAMTAAAGGAVVLKRGLGFMKEAVGGVSDLAKSTAGLQRITGMDARAASGWVSIAKERGVQSKQLNQGFITLARNMSSAASGSKASASAFQQLGLDAASLKVQDPAIQLGMLADSFKALPAGADKAAVAQKLFGRQSQAMLPLLNSGAKGIEEQMGAMDKYGLTLDQSGVKKGLELVKSQREMKSSMEGIKNTVGAALIPAIVSITNAITPVITAFSQLLQSSPVLQGVILGLAGALAALLVITTVAGAIAVILPMLPLMAAGFTAVWAAITGPVGLVVVGVLAVVAAFVLLYNKVGWFHDAVDAAWGAIKTGATAAFNAIVAAGQFAFNWIKGNWPLLLGILTGPFGLAVALIVTHFGKIKQIAVDAFNAIKTAISGVVSFISGNLVGAFDAVIGKVREAVQAVNDLIGAVKNIPSDVAGGAKSLVSKLNPFAAGGVVGVGGTLALVGERGPEIMQLPGGTRITPLAAGTQTPVDVGWGGGDIHVHVDVDGRELAHVVARQTADQLAAR